MEHIAPACPFLTPALFRNDGVHNRHMADLFQGAAHSQYGREQNKGQN